MNDNIYLGIVQNLGNIFSLSATFKILKERGSDLDSEQFGLVFNDQGKFDMNSSISAIAKEMGLQLDKKLKPLGFAKTTRSVNYPIVVGETKKNVKIDCDFSAVCNYLEDLNSKSLCNNKERKVNADTISAMREFQRTDDYRKLHTFDCFSTTGGIGWRAFRLSYTASTGASFRSREMTCSYHRKKIGYHNFTSMSPGYGVTNFIDSIDTLVNYRKILSENYFRIEGKKIPLLNLFSVPLSDLQENYCHVDISKYDVGVDLLDEV